MDLSVESPLSGRGQRLLRHADLHQEALDLAAQHVGARGELARGAEHGLGFVARLDRRLRHVIDQLGPSSTVRFTK